MAVADVQKKKKKKKKKKISTRGRGAWGWGWGLASNEEMTRGPSSKAHKSLN